MVTGVIPCRYVSRHLIQIKFNDYRAVQDARWLAGWLGMCVRVYVFAVCLCVCVCVCVCVHYI